MSETKKLFRKSSDKKIAGVCSGLGEYLNLDPNIVRIVFVLLALFVGGGLILYLILWLILPEHYA
jgi:phage shock protein PspC (stress-responsive transcriptional regulator)